MTPDRCWGPSEGPEGGENPAELVAAEIGPLYLTSACIFFPLPEMAFGW